jgi:hypothetical protein
MIVPFIRFLNGTVFVIFAIDAYDVGCFLGKKLVRITYQPTDGKQEWKMLHLEAEPDDTWRIVSKMNDLVDVNKSPARLTYLAKTPTKRLPAFLQFGSTSTLTMPRRNSEQSSASKKSLHAPDFR